MTLSKFKSSFFSRPTCAVSAKLYVFKSDEDADTWIRWKYLGEGYDEFSLDLVIQSDMIAEYSLNDRWCKAEVKHFYAVEPDVIVVVAEPYEEEGNKK